MEEKVYAFPISRAHFAQDGHMISSDWVPGMLLRDYFAAHAPEIPDWFKHEPAPDAPKEVPHASELAGPRPEEEYGVEAAAWRNRVNAIHAGQRDEYKKYREQHSAWTVRDHFARLAQWRYAYADAMLATRKQ